MSAVGEGCISAVAGAGADLQHPLLDSSISAKSQWEGQEYRLQ